MKIQVVLQRVGSSRVSFDCIPIEARVLQGGRLGNDLVSRIRPTTLESAKSYAEMELSSMLRQTVEVEWLDQTEAGLET